MTLHRYAWTSRGLPERQVSLQSWSVFPNPAQGSAYINYTLAAPTQIRIELYDVLGKQVSCMMKGIQQTGEYTAHIDTRKLGDGIYVLQIHAGDQVASLKIAVVN